MHLVELPLELLFSALLRVAHHHGYSLVLTVVVPEPDAAQIYEALAAWWSSSHTLVGPHVLVLVVGPDAAEALVPALVRSGKDTQNYARSLALAGGHADAEQRPELRDDALAKRRTKARALDDQALALTKFRRRFADPALPSRDSAPELERPCLHLSFLASSGEVRHERMTWAETASLPDALVRTLADAEGPLDRLDTHRRTLAETTAIRRQHWSTLHRHSRQHDEVSHKFHFEATRLEQWLDSTDEEAEVVEEVLRGVLGGTFDSALRSACFRQMVRVKPGQGHTELVRQLQRVIDLRTLVERRKQQELERQHQDQREAELLALIASADQRILAQRAQEQVELDRLREIVLGALEPHDIDGPRA